MMQIKKKFFIFFFAVIFSLPIHHYDSIMVKAAEIKNFTDVADQKSVIEEQQKLKELYSAQYSYIINTLTEEEKELICRITYLEAGNQCIEGQRAVIEVILNRIISPRWPNTIVEVLSAPRQFGTWRIRNRVSQKQINTMRIALNLVDYSKDTILPDNEYVYFNCKSKKNGIKIQSQWFWK